METSFRLDSGRTLIVGNNLSTPNSLQSRGFIGLVLKDTGESSPAPSGRNQHVRYACGTTASADIRMASLPDKCPHQCKCEAVGRWSDPEEPEVKWTQLACLKPHEARALASAILSAATEAKS